MKMKKNYLLAPLYMLVILTLTASTWSMEGTEKKEEKVDTHTEDTTSHSPFHGDKKIKIQDFLNQPKLGDTYAIIGGGLAHGTDYLRNHFLIDNKKIYKPDKTMDITLSHIHHSLVGVFDYVVTEFVPMSELAKPNTFTNIASLLKRNGKYISNQICSVKEISEVTREVATQSHEYSKGMAYYLPENSPQYPFYIFYEDGKMAYDELHELCFNVIVKPLLERAGFTDVKLTNNPYHDNRLKKLRSPIIEATKR